MIEAHVHHCCVRHFCEYGDDECLVVDGQVEQKYPCEYCHEDDVDEETRLMGAAMLSTPVLYHELKVAETRVKVFLAELDRRNNK